MFKITDGTIIDTSSLELNDVEFENCRFNKASNSIFMNCEFYDCNLSGAFLTHSTFVNCEFKNCNFNGAHLTNAQIRNGSLKECNFYNADLSKAHISDETIKKNCVFLEYNCPKEGKFIGYKKVEGSTKTNLYSKKPPIKVDAIVTLEIPENAKRLSSTSKKCRCSEAKVINIEIIHKPHDTKIEDYRFYSYYDRSFEYKVGDIVKPKWGFDEDRWNECASGIHFFMNKEDAIQFP